MEFDPSRLQLWFNLIAITAITSLALFCFLLKRDKDRLTTELHQLRSQGRKPPSVSTLREKQSPKLESTPKPQPAAGRVRPPGPDASPTSHQDIREFVARRVDGWIARSATHS
jgi:hypothetical protein